jgi:hypothetical protein
LRILSFLSMSTNLKKLSRKKPQGPAAEVWVAESVYPRLDRGKLRPITRQESRGGVRALGGWRREPTNRRKNS